MLFAFNFSTYVPNFSQYEFLMVCPSVEVHQLDIILCALDDYSTLLREKLHTMLQVCSLATKGRVPLIYLF